MHKNSFLNIDLKNYADPVDKNSTHDLDNRTYCNLESHKNVENGRVDKKSMDVETVHKETEYKKKKIKITLEFPYTVDPSEAARIERNLRGIYLNKMKEKALQMSLSAVPFPTPKGKIETGEGGNDND